MKCGEKFSEGSEGGGGSGYGALPKRQTLPPPPRRPRAHQANMANEQGSESWGKEKDQLSVSRSVLMSKTHFHACVLCLHTLDGRVPLQRTQVFIRYHFTWYHASRQFWCSQYNGGQSSSDRSAMEYRSIVHCEHTLVRQWHGGIILGNTVVVFEEKTWGKLHQRKQSLNNVFFFFSLQKFPLWNPVCFSKLLFFFPCDFVGGLLTAVKPVCSHLLFWVFAGERMDAV